MTRKVLRTAAAAGILIALASCNTPQVSQTSIADEQRVKEEQQRYFDRDNGAQQARYEAEQRRREGTKR